MVGDCETYGPREKNGHVMWGARAAWLKWILTSQLTGALLIHMLLRHCLIAAVSFPSIYFTIRACFSCAIFKKKLKLLIFSLCRFMVKCWIISFFSCFFGFFFVFLFFFPCFLFLFFIFFWFSITFMGFFIFFLCIFFLMIFFV
jgi:hypothetical protein